MAFLKKRLFVIFLFFYFLIGSTNSINTGISFDENYEQLNWDFNVKLVKDISNSILTDQQFDKDKFNDEVKSFVGYGIGFQIISQPIQFLVKNFIDSDNNLEIYGAKLLSKHFVVFLFFFVSGIFFYLILRKIIENVNCCSLGTIIYLTYPYLFGQSMFSPKDIPFMSVWLICTFLILNLFEKLVDKKKIDYKSIIILSITTAYLLSIRIAGLLIFIQYIFTLLIFLNINKIKLNTFLKKYYLIFITFIFTFTLFLFLFYPIFWIDPLLIIETIKISSQHFNNVGTTTLGEIMYAGDLPVTYLIIWFAVKLPLLVLIGLIIVPFVEKKIFNDKKKAIIFGSLLATLLTIIFILILRRVHLYDEIRQVMFLVPLIFIISTVAIFTFSRNFFKFFGVITVLFFIAENIKINPYQYVWFNLPSRYLDLTKNFELEYQGISGREISKYIINRKPQESCILANPLLGVKLFLKNTEYICFDIWQKIETDYQRPFLAVQNVRNLKRSIPYKCKPIYETNFKLFFHKKKITTGKLLRCE